MRSRNIADGNARVGLQVDGDVVITGGIHLGMPAGDGTGMTIQVGGLTIGLDAEEDGQ